MKCLKCESPLTYGDKFCNICGEKIEKRVYEEDYKKTIWGKIDKLTDWYDTLLFKKITDSIIFKIVILVLILLWGVFDVYTDLADIRILESENYTAEYNKKSDEYYIYTNDEEVILNVYVPGYTENVKVKEFLENDIKNEREITSVQGNSGLITVKKGDFDYIIIDTLRNEKVTDSVKLYITE